MQDFLEKLFDLCGTYNTIRSILKHRYLCRNRQRYLQKTFSYPIFWCWGWISPTTKFIDLYWWGGFHQHFFLWNRMKEMETKHFQRLNRLIWVWEIDSKRFNNSIFNHFGDIKDQKFCWWNPPPDIKISKRLCRWNPPSNTLIRTKLF